MSKIKFDNGVTVNFDGTPTPQDVEEVAQNLNLKPEQQAQDKPGFFKGLGLVVYAMWRVSLSTQADG